jgi:hypothetical protein
MRYYTMLEAIPLAKEYVPMRIGRPAHKRLTKYGKVSESFEDAITRLMDFADEHWDEYRKKMETD